MRWIITTVLIVIIAVFGWFWYPRLMPASETDPIDLIPENAWLIIETTASNAHLQITDSTSILTDLSVIESVFKLLEKTGNQLENNEEKLTLFLYGSTDNPSLGLIESKKSSLAAFEDLFSNHQDIGNYRLYSNEPIENNTLDQSKLKKLLNAGSLGSISICAKPKQVIEFYSNKMASELKIILEQEIVTDDWVGFELREDGSLFIANGVGSSKNDETGKKRDLNLLRYLPSKTGIAILTSADSTAYAMVYCPYSSDNETVHENLFVLLAEESDKETEVSDDLAYQGIPISIGPLPSSLTHLNVAWKEVSYAAHLGSVRIHASSFKQLTYLLDDYLADDKLISSAYFKHVEPAISDASFTFYMRPEMLKGENPFIVDETDLGKVNTLVFQCFSELPLQKFYSLSIVHHTEFVDEASILWSLLLDTTIAAGPWAFTNHYSKENEVIVQDSKNQLYLINKEGKTLWKQKLDAKIAGDVQMIDAFKSGKYQMIFNTSSSVYLLDRNGKNVGEFPIKLSEKAIVSPSIVQYDSKGDYRLLIADGKTILNLDIDGKPVKGWNNPSLDSPAISSISYLSYSGKDYLNVISSTNHIYFFDRTGKERIKNIAADTAAFNLQLKKGKSLNECVFIGYDSIGNIHTTQPSKENSLKNILPIGGDVGMIVYDNTQHNYITLKNDRLLTLSSKFDVELDFLLPEEMSNEIQVISKDKGWIGFANAAGNHFYIFDLEGRMLDKMPLKGSGKALLIDIDKNGSQELVTGNGKRELMVYKLAD